MIRLPLELGSMLQEHLLLYLEHMLELRHLSFQAISTLAVLTVVFRSLKKTKRCLGLGHPWGGYVTAARGVWHL